MTDIIKADKVKGGTLSVSQGENGMYMAQIRWDDGGVSGATRKTMNEIQKWVCEQESFEPASH